MLSYVVCSNVYPSKVYFLYPVVKSAGTHLSQILVLHQWKYHFACGFADWSLECVSCMCHAVMVLNFSLIILKKCRYWSNKENLSFLNKALLFCIVPSPTFDIGDTPCGSLLIFLCYVCPCQVLMYSFHCLLKNFSL